jgi:NADPH-dependent ferric siderophore reductase
VTEPATIRHAIDRVRREPKRRRLTVESVDALTPKMRRIVLTSPELVDFVSLGADDPIKVFAPDAAAPQGVAMRDYTPRAVDASRGALAIDFVLHEAGPASDWARRAKPGDPLDIGGSACGPIWIYGTK